MPILTLRNVQLGFGSAPLLDGVDLSVEKGERLCVVGRNGTGKSTLLKVMAGELMPDDGLVEKPRGLVVARLVQEVPGDLDGPVRQVVAGGLADLGRALVEYQRLGADLAGADARTLERFAALQSDIEVRGGWELEQRIDAVLSRLGLDGDQEFGDLSGGLKRRVMLAHALVQAPDILLLDEPTNHLDIESIGWLETFFREWQGTLVFITHDRAFVRALATRIVELDRGRLTSWPGNYGKYLEGKQKQLEAELAAEALFDKRLSEEEKWIRQGIKARRTRNEGRVRALEAMRRDRAARRQRTGQASLQLQDSNLSGKLVIEAEHLCCAFDGRTLVQDFSTRIFRGDRIGIIGPNGCGKSTLLKVLLGRLPPRRGEVRPGTNLEVAWFDQLRESLHGDRSVFENLVEGSDYVTVNGRQKHAVGYLQDFLFTPDRIRQPASALSGGERNRLLLARLFSRSFNLLVMDEPTNDLDAETLELLEEQLMNYQGTLLLVSHDREFLDNVVTSTLVFEHDTVNEYVGGYHDWLRQRPAPPDPRPSPASPVRTGRAGERQRPGNGETENTARKRLSFREQRELEALPGQIEALEGRIAELQRRLGDPQLFRSDPPGAGELGRQLAGLEQELEQAFERWQTLE